MNLYQEAKTQVWARSMDTEGGTAPRVENHGGDLSLFGLKTEQGGTVITTDSGGRTDALGVLVYCSAGQPAGSSPAFVNVDSQHSINWMSRGGNSSSVYATWVSETKNGVTRTKTTASQSHDTYGRADSLHVGILN
jgi:hypothetical protein